MMLSIRARMINGALRGIRRSGITDRFVAALDNPVALRAALPGIRRFDELEPPKRLRRHHLHEVVSLDGGPLHLLTPIGGGQRRVLLYLHGGGYMIGPSRIHWTSAMALCREGGADLAMLIYPKTPEHHHEAVVACASDAFDVLADRYGAENIVVAGDSAGGGLGATLLTVLRDTGRRQPHAAVLISPWLDITMSDPAAAAQEATDHVLTVEAAIRAGRFYAGDRSPDDPLISPRFATTSGLAPIHVFVGSEEIFLADCRSFAATARAHGDEVTIRVMNKGQHVSAIFPTPEGRIARAQMVALVDWP
jgi:epsilon-lactone hydrolase